MLDRQTSELLKVLNSFCKDGSYKVLDKNEIIEKMSTRYNIDKDSLSQMLSHLAERNYLNIKYADNEVYCLAVLPKGRLFDEKVREMSIERKKYNKNLTITIIVSSVCGFLGSMLGVLLSKLIF